MGLGDAVEEGGVAQAACVRRIGEEGCLGQHIVAAREGPAHGRDITGMDPGRVPLVAVAETTFSSLLQGIRHVHGEWWYLGPWVDDDLDALKGRVLPIAVQVDRDQPAVIEAIVGAKEHGVGEADARVERDKMIAGAGHEDLCATFMEPALQAYGQIEDYLFFAEATAGRIDTPIVAAMAGVEHDTHALKVASRRGMCLWRDEQQRKRDEEEATSLQSPTPKGHPA